jgi:hypothetical protein
MGIKLEAAFISGDFQMFRTIYFPPRYFSDDLQWQPNRNEIVQKIEFLRLLKSLTDSNIDANFASQIV